ncbi:hypothetical protein LUZ60_011412 [Juncus effusus]|nr:hypothetical protein LUZ60_011412 [Juncus effusus]
MRFCGGTFEIWPNIFPFCYFVGAQMIFRNIAGVPMQLRPQAQRVKTSPRSSSLSKSKLVRTRKKEMHNPSSSQSQSPSPFPSQTPATATATGKGKAPASAAAQSQSADPSLKRKRGFFQKDLQHMMYGFGDDPNPLPETVALVEDIVVEYITDLVHKAQNVASKRGKLLTEDFLYLIRKDLPKLHRCTELLSMNEELKQARKAFDVTEENLANAE